MQVCHEHSLMLQQRLKDKGLGHLLAKSEEEFNKHADDGPLKTTNPYIRQAFMICIIFVTKYIATGEMKNPEDVHFCPLCHLEKNDKEVFDSWVEGSTDDQVNIAAQRLESEGNAATTMTRQ